MKDLSIVIVNWNSWDYAEKCLKSIRTAVQNLKYEVIFIDNASREDLSEQIKRDFKGLNLKLIRNGENLGFAKACNQAVRISEGEFILLLNPDTVVEQNAISNSLEFLEKNPKTGVLGSRLKNLDGSLQKWTGGRFPSMGTAFSHYFFLSNLKLFKGIYLFQDLGIPEEVDWVSGAFMVVRRKAIDQVGLFDEDFFMYGEDMDLCFRMKQAGWNVIYFPGAEVIHYSGKSIEQANQDRYWKGLLSISVFYERRSGGGFKRFVFDLITAAGFLLRSFMFTVAGIFTFNEKFFKQANISWNFFLGALKILTGQTSFRRGIGTPIAA